MSTTWLVKPMHDESVCNVAESVDIWTGPARRRSEVALQSKAKGIRLALRMGAKAADLAQGDSSEPSSPASRVAATPATHRT